MFFPPEKDNKNSQSIIAPATINFAKPWVLGFEYSRPEADFFLGITDIYLAQDIYRHPVRQGQPGMMFNELHDIYTLGTPPFSLSPSLFPFQLTNKTGVVLLEIGLWEVAITLEKNQFKHARDPYVIQAKLQKQTSRGLGGRIGEQVFRIQVVDVLERAAANV
jgi:hypothetical protein